jgi:hypothetical protein
MKVKAYTLTEIEVRSVIIDIYVGCIWETVPRTNIHDIPLVVDDRWRIRVNVDSGQICGWPENSAIKIEANVRDSGKYFLIDNEGEVIESLIEEPVPNQLIPGGDGDYIDLDIGDDGVIKNWPEYPAVDQFSRFFYSEDRESGLYQHMYTD